MDTLEILTKARSVIERPECWVKGDTAQNCHGECTSWYDPDAVAFCATGAVYRVKVGREADEALFLLQKAMGDKIVRFNDAPGTTHDMVMAAFDKAIARLKTVVGAAHEGR